MNDVSWDVDSLKEYVDSRLVDQQRAADQALDAVNLATLKANEASEKRFESVNEFRNSLADQTANFLTRSEYYAAHQSLEKRIQDLTDRINIMTGSSTGLSRSWGLLAGGVSAGAAVVAIIYYLSHLH